VPEPKLTSVSPILPVKDLRRALDFYQKVMGFEEGWVAGDPPRIASVCREAVELMLREEPATSQASIYIGVNGVDDYFERVSRAGAKVNYAIADREYGMRDFTIEDSEGNQVAVGEPIVGLE
jgi:predicted enzyme related to lactoylglutathione lyase